MRKIIPAIFALFALTAVIIILGCEQTVKECNEDADCPQPRCPEIKAQCINGRCVQPRCSLSDSACSSDSDCATGGCSGQLCTTKEKSQNLITTCEYMPEYACYELTSCSCIEGKCEWKETEEFEECFEKTKA